MKFWNKPPIAHTYIYNIITAMHCQIQRISWPALWRFDDFVFGGLTGWEFLFWGAKAGLSVEGAKLRLPKARSPSRLGGLGERRKLPQRGLRRNPRIRRDFEHFKPKWSTFCNPGNLTFLNSLKCTKSLRFINKECYYYLAS